MKDKKLDIVEDVEEEDLLSEQEQEELSISDAIDSILESDDEDEEDESSDEDETDDEDEEEYSEEEVEEKAKKESAKAKKMKKIKEDLDILVSKEANLSEGFKEKAQTLFEAAVSEKVVAEKERLEILHEEKLQSELSQIRDHFTDQIDSYLGYVVEAFVEENQGLVESVCRTEITENFMKKLHSVFVESYIDVPETKRDLVEELATELEETRNELEESKLSANQLAEGVISLKREQILSESAKGLTATEVEKLKRLTSEIEFNSVQSFQSKIDTIKESVFNIRTDVIEEAEELFDDGEEIETQQIVEGEEIITKDEQPKLDPEIARYVSFLSH